MIQIIQAIPFFSTLSPDDLNSIAQTIKMDYFPANHTVFEKGDIGSIMYIIKRGQVQVIRDQHILAELKDGDFFGEMALVSDEPRNATVKTVTDVEVLTLNKEDFDRLISTNQNIASRVSYEVVKRSNVL